MAGRRSRVYRRLAGRARRPLSVATLWLAADHLMLVGNQGYQETYRRLYLRDIQAVLSRPTRTHHEYAALFALTTLLLGGLAAGTSGGWRIFWSLPLAASLVALLVNFARGPSCVVHMMTPLETVEIRPLRRRRWLRAAMARLRPLIDQAQGTMPAEEIARQVAAVSEASPSAAPDPARAVPAAGPPPLVRPGRVRAHACLSAALLLDAVVTVYQLPDQNPVLDLVAVLVFLGALGSAVYAVVSQAGTDLPPGLRTLTWTSLLFLMGIFMVGFVTTWVELIGSGAEAPTILSPKTWGVRMTGPVEIAGDAILATWGVVLVLRHRREREMPWVNLKV